MAHGFFYTCSRCNPSVTDALFGSSKKSKKPNFQSRSNKNQQSRQRSAERANNQHNRSAGEALTAAKYTTRKAGTATDDATDHPT